MTDVGLSVDSSLRDVIHSGPVLQPELSEVLLDVGLIVMDVDIFVDRWLRSAASADVHCDTLFGAFVFFGSVAFGYFAYFALL